MTRDGLTEENLRDGTIKDISHKSRGRPEEKLESFLPERERKKLDADTDKPNSRTRKQRNKIRHSSVRQESVEAGEDVTPENQISGYRKKLRQHEKIPDASGLDGQKQAIRKKQIRRQMTKEQAKAGRLSFDDEGNQMVQGAGMKPGGTAGGIRALQRTVSDVQSVMRDDEETDENTEVESARFTEHATETAVHGLRQAQLRNRRTDVKTFRRGYEERGTEKKLKFDTAETLGKTGTMDTAEQAGKKKHFYNRFFQKKRYKDAYRAARAGKAAGSLGGAETIAGEPIKKLVRCLCLPCISTIGPVDQF